VPPIATLPVETPPVAVMMVLIVIHLGGYIKTGLYLAQRITCKKPIEQSLSCSYTLCGWQGVHRLYPPVSLSRR
jgi:hypothetical protein